MTFWMIFGGVFYWWPDFSNLLLTSTWQYLFSSLFNLLYLYVVLNTPSEHSCCCLGYQNFVSINIPGSIASHTALNLMTFSTVPNGRRMGFYQLVHGILVHGTLAHGTLVGGTLVHGTLVGRRMGFTNWCHPVDCNWPPLFPHTTHSTRTGTALILHQVQHSR